MQMEKPTRSEHMAMRFNACGQRLEEQGRFDRALIAYRRAAELASHWSVPWYNMGLHYKYKNDWAAARACNRRAVELGAANEAAWWNLGIAATALGDWAEARRAWQGFGLAVPSGDGPVSLPCGLTPIRVNPMDQPEVVWCDRIDPARAIVRNVPLPQCQRRFGDLVLHDGAPNGYRMSGDVELAVFDELALLQASSYLTMEAHIGGVTALALESLSRAFQQVDEGCCEVWSSTVRMLCRACSEGRPHDEHEYIQAGSNGFFKVGIASLSEAAARAVLDQWLEKTPGAALLHFETVLRPPHAAFPAR